MIFPRWDATGFDCLAKHPGRGLASLLPQPCCPGASASREHSHYIYSPEAARYFCEKKIFSKCSGAGGWGGGVKKPVEIFVSGFILSPSWLSRKLLSGVWPIFYFIIKGKNISFSSVSASLSKSNILNI